MGTKEMDAYGNFSVTGVKDHSELTLKKNQDSVFSKLYSDPERVFDLYKTLHREDCKEFSVDDVEMITLENIVLARRCDLGVKGKSD